MLSVRSAFSLLENAIARAVAKRREARAPLLDLTESNPTQAGIEYPAAEIRVAMWDERSLTYEPTAAGLPAARVAVAAYYLARGHHVPPERIRLTASTSESYAVLLKLLADPGERILVPRPSYPLFDYLARLEAVGVDHYDLRYDGGWHVDLPNLRAGISRNTKAIMLVTPNNPTGSVITLEERAEIFALAAQFGIAVVSDEVFADYAPGYPRPLALDAPALTFSLGGLSKAAGLPQLKAGWIVSGGPPRELAEAESRLELILDTYLSVATPVMHALPELVRLSRTLAGSIRARTGENLALLQRALAGWSEAPLTLLRHEAGWSAILRVPATISEEQWVLDLVEKDGVLVHPGFFFDLASEAHLVVSLLTHPDDFAAGISAIFARAAAEAGLAPPGPLS